MRLVALAALLGLLAGAGPQTASAQQVALRPWNASDGLTAKWTRPMNHGNDGGLALSPDGRLLAIGSMFQPSSEIRLVDLEERTGWRLVHPDWRIDLSQPAFSPDGRRLALLVSAPLHRGVTEIWIMAPEGGPVLQRIAAPARSYSRPAFSPDGRRIAYFRDVEPERPVDAPGFPEFALKSAFAIFEYDLSTGTETQLAPQAFSYGCGLFYQAQDEGVFYCASGAKEYGRAAPGLPWRWQDRLAVPGEESEFQYETRTNYARAFYLARGAQIARWPDPAAPNEPGIKGHALIGARQDGSVLLSSSGPEPFPIEFPMTERYTAFKAGGPPETVEVTIHAFGCSKRAASADGRTFAFEGDCTHAKRNDDYKPKPSSFFITRDGKLEVIPSQKVAFEPTVRIIAPPEGSYFATTAPTRYDWPTR